jgi:F-type H+-transporting ATPase subunit b
MEAIVPNYSVVVQAIIFFLALFLIKKLILDPMMDVLKRRNERIEGAEREAVRLQGESTLLDEKYKGKIREARAKAQSERAQRKLQALGEERKILDKGREEANKRLKGISLEIQKESAEARASLRGYAEDLSRVLAEKLLGRSIS